MAIVLNTRRYNKFIFFHIEDVNADSLKTLENRKCQTIPNISNPPTATLYVLSMPKKKKKKSKRGLQTQ